MPRYDYRCKECAEVWETEHPMTYEGPVECPVCKTSLTHKIILETPGIWIYWKDARSSSEARLPSYLTPIKNRRRRGRQRSEAGG